VANGQSVHTHRWADLVASAGAEVHVVTPEEYLGDRARVTVHQVGSRALPSPGSVATRRGAAMEKVVRSARAVRSVRADLVHGHYLVTYGQAAWLAHRRPLVLTAWGTDVFGIGEVSRVSRWMIRAALTAAAAVTVDSEDLRTAVGVLGVETEKLRLIPFGIDTTTFRPATVRSRHIMNELGVPPDVPVVFSPRSVAPVYDTATIVRAVSALVCGGRAVHLVVKDYRGESTYRRSIEELVDHLGIRDRVTFVGERPYGDMADLYRAADVVVSVARSDSAPVSVVEALACGAVVVAGDLPSLREWITDGDNGLLAPVGDAARLAKRIGEALDLEPGILQQWVKHNTSEVSTRASNEVMLRAVIALYDEVMRQSRARVHERLARPSGETC
jgi:glycosyltransferase involved in cell wall biosynthesis